ncbi:MAG: ThuA domain-containing protein [Mariniphaga sp.]
MKKQYSLILTFGILITIFGACNFDGHFKALVVTGQNNHNWKASSPILKQLLEQTGIFTAEIIKTPEKGGDMNTFNPDFSKYELVVLDYSGDSWSEKTKTAFIKYVKDGGGVVIYHAADNSFPEWKEYNEMIGLGWGRTEKDGPYYYYSFAGNKRNEKQVIDTTAGKGGSHGQRHEFAVKIRNMEHPVTKGLPVIWFHGKDELYSKLRGPAKNMEILATAYADTSLGGTGRNEPVLMTTRYGKGRVFHTVLGHADQGGGPAMECAGFIVTFQRGAEWAASGKVTQKVPYDFPTAVSVSLRTNFQEITIEEDLAKIPAYDLTKSTKYFVNLQNRIRAEGKTRHKLQKFENMIIKMLEDKAATNEAKKLLLHEISWMGSDLCIPVIRELAKNPELKESADYALARLEQIN